MSFRDSRPFLDNLTIYPYICINTYGNPSASVMYLTAMSLVIILNPTSGLRKATVRGMDGQVKVAARTSCQKIVHALGICVFVFLEVNFCLCKFCFGLNSLDELAFGIGLGVWIGFFCNGVIRKPLDRHITTLMNGEYQARGYAPVLRALAIICASVSFMMLVVDLAFREEISTKHPSWAEAIQMHCDEDSQE